MIARERSGKQLAVKNYCDDEDYLDQKGGALEGGTYRAHRDPAPA